MKRLLLITLSLSFYPFIAAQAQSQTPSRERPEFSLHSKRTRFAKPPARAFEPHSWLEEMEGDSLEMAQQDERLRSSLPPHLRGMKNLPPHILAERRWLWESETGDIPQGAAGLKPNDPLDRLYPPHKRSFAQTPNLFKNNAIDPFAQSFQSSTTQILSGGVQEAWVARHDEPGHAGDFATAMATDGSGNIYVTGYSQSVGSSPDYLTIKYSASGVQQWSARYNGPGNTNDYAVALAVDGAGNVYVTGSIFEYYDDEEDEAKQHREIIVAWRFHPTSAFFISATTLPRTITWCARSIST